MEQNKYIVSPESVADFLDFEASRGASGNMLSRFSCAANSLYEFLPADKQVSKELLSEWREGLTKQGYSAATVQNYVKYVNRYLDRAGLSELRFNRGRGKDISGMTFGYLTALEPTEKRHRRDVVWLCKCRCGTVLELPATRLLRNNTLSCGCINKVQIQRVNKYIADTSLRQSLDDKSVSAVSESGYVGVVKKRGKWQAQITYKKKLYVLGVFSELEDAVKARARAKEAVMEDAEELLEAYEELHKDDAALPERNEDHQALLASRNIKNSASTAKVKRIDNQSGHPGVNFRKNKWEARICYKGIRYMLGRFEVKESAVEERKNAEALLESSPEAFVEHYSKNCKQYAV